jgi:hypothetical protein
MSQKKETNNLKVHRAKDMYDWFKKNNPDTDITYALFKETISLFNKTAVEYILEGHTVRFGKYLGGFRIKKIERKFSEKPKHINWGETNKLLKQGIKKFVYWVDDYYFKWHWEKSTCKIKNKTVYVFQPTKGDGGNRKKLSRLLMSDEFAKTLYKE